MSKTDESKLAVNGGPKTLEGFEGRAQPKIGVDEFMALAEIWGFSEKAREAIHDAIAGEDIGGGAWLTRYYNPGRSRVKEMEELVCQLFGVPYVLAVHSGTSALETAYVACEVGPGTEVIVPGYTFFATAAAVVSAKAIPVIADIDESLTMDPADLEKKITPRTKAILPVHMVGTNANMDAIMDVANRHGIQVIEDVAQACGARFDGKRLGTFGAAGCFSISTYKIVGGGEAGLVMTGDERIYTRAQNHHDTGACWRPDRYAKERMPGELFCGTNYRLSELEGAVNYVQLQKMDALVDRFRTNKARVLAGLRRFEGIDPQRVNDYDGEVGNHLVFFAPTPEGAQRIAAALNAEGVGAGARGDSRARDWHIFAYWEHILEHKAATVEGCPFTCPYYNVPLPAYSEDMCPRTLDLLSRAVFVSISQWWSERDCALVAEAVSKVLGAFHTEDPAGRAWRQ